MRSPDPFFINVVVTFVWFTCVLLVMNTAINLAQYLVYIRNNRKKAGIDRKSVKKLNMKWYQKAFAFIVGYFFFVFVVKRNRNRKV